MDRTVRNLDSKSDLSDIAARQSTRREWVAPQRTRISSARYTYGKQINLSIESENSPGCYPPS